MRKEKGSANAPRFHMAEFKEWVPGEATGYWQEEAPEDAVKYILHQQEEEPNGNGRSRWMWIRLPDGDLCLATYPQGETYFATEYLRTI